jgi:hypothetical protein
MRLATEMMMMMTMTMMVMTRTKVTVWCTALWCCQILNRYQLLTAKEQIFLVNLSKRDYLRKANRWLPRINEVRVTGQALSPTVTSVPQSTSCDGSMAEMTGRLAVTLCLTWVFLFRRRWRSKGAASSSPSPWSLSRWVTRGHVLQSRERSFLVA